MGQSFIVGDSQYYIDVEEKYNWAESLANCMERDMILVSIEIREKWIEIIRWLNNYIGKHHLWVGGIMSRNDGNHFI
ncbi:lectin subunit alpha-like [Cochliomyia hominivorax]